jgi:hypothetical protein
MKHLFLLVFLVATALADVGGEVFIRGKISNEFDDAKVKVVDSDNQIYFLPRAAFPKDFEIKQGKAFTLEVSEEHLAQVKLLKK